MHQERTVRKSRWITLACWIACTNTALADDGHFYLGAELGKSYSALSDNNPSISYDQGYFTDTYPLNSSRSSTGDVGVQSGYQWSGSGVRPAIAVGIGLYTTPNTYRYTGQVAQTPLGSPDNTLFDYSFRIRSTRLMAETQFTWTLANHLAPFVEAGVGPAWTRLMDYQETAITTNLQPALPGFESHTNSTIAYQAGFGVSYAFNTDPKTQFQHERLSLGYRLVTVGNVSFASRGSDYPYTLSLGNLKTQETYLSVTHYF